MANYDVHFYVMPDESTAFTFIHYAAVGLTWGM